MRRSMIYGIAALSLFGAGVTLDTRAHLAEISPGERLTLPSMMEEYNNHPEYYIPSVLAAVPLYLMYRDLRRNKKDGTPKPPLDE